MTPPRLSTEALTKIAANPTAFKSTGIRQAMAEELIEARERIVKLDAALDAALVAIEQYHAILFGAPRAREKG